MELGKLAEVFNSYFSEPFLPKGTVKAILQPDGTLKIYIGRRDVHVDDSGYVLGAGTCLRTSVTETI